MVTKKNQIKNTTDKQKIKVKCFKKRVIIGKIVEFKDQKQLKMLKTNKTNL